MVVIHGSRIGQSQAEKEWEQKDDSKSQSSLVVHRDRGPLELRMERMEQPKPGSPHLELPLQRRINWPSFSLFTIHPPLHTPPNAHPVRQSRLANLRVGIGRIPGLPTSAFPG